MWPKQYKPANTDAARKSALAEGLFRAIDILLHR
jgi:hypothetical protein